MALHSVMRRKDLGENLILAPERYDPRRKALLPKEGEKYVLLGEIVSLENQTINATKEIHSKKRYLIFDTSDVLEGVIVGRKTPIYGAEIGSSKKIIRPNDVIISRLRPYLRQVGYVDEFFEKKWGDGVELISSTEFFVLRAKKKNEDIAFLTTFLLTESVQNVLKASQEGGHHPRFNADVLLSLPVPEGLMKKKRDVSNAIKRAVKLYRESRNIIEKNIKESTQENSLINY